METPPPELRKRLQRAQETNKYLEAELSELREFTKLESQFMLLEEGCSKLGDEQSMLTAELEGLKKSHDEFKNVLSVKCYEKKNFLMELVTKSDGSDFKKEIEAVFEELSNLIDAKGPSGDSSSAKVLSSPVINSKTLEMVQIELSKIRLTLKAPRRLSDSSLVVDRFRKPKTLISRSNALCQTETNELDVAKTDDASNVLDVSISAMHGAGDKLPDMPLLIPDVHDLELKLAELNEECRKLKSANYNLELMVEDKCSEIQELMDLLDETRASCVCKPPVGIEDPSDRSECSDSRRNLSSFLPTILEASFDGADLHESSFSPESHPTLNSNSEEVVVKQEPEEITELRRCNNFLASELDYCLSEVGTKDEQIALMQAIATPAETPEWGVLCDQQLEALESIFADSEALQNDCIKSEVIVQLEHALSVMQNYVDSSLSSPKFDFSPIVNNESSILNESAVNDTLGPDACFLQALCSPVFNASSNASVNISIVQNPEDAKLIKIMNYVRSLRNCTFSVISNFSQEIFIAINKLAKMECIVQRLRNKRIAGDATCAFYKSVVLKDIKEKADAVLGIHDSVVNYSFAGFNHSDVQRRASEVDMPKRRSVDSGNDTLHFSMLAGDRLEADETLRLSITGEGYQGADKPEEFTIPTGDVKFKSEVTAIYSSICKLCSKLEQLGFLKHKADGPQQQDSWSIAMKSIAVLVEEVKELLNPLLTPLHYDPECTQFLSMDVSSLNSDTPAKRILQTSQTVNQNEVIDENKENALENTVKNYNKLIVESKTRMDELEVARSDAEMKLTQKLAEHKALKEEIETLKSELTLKKLEVVENSAEVDRLKDLISNQSSDLKASKTEIDCLKEELQSSKLIQVELALASEALSEKNSDLELKLEMTNSLISEKEKLESELNQNCGALLKANEYIVQLEDDLRQMAAGKEETEINLKQIQSAKEALEDALKHKAEELQSTCERLAELEMSKATDRVTELEQLLDLEVAEKRILQTELERLFEEHSVAEAKISELQSAVASMMSEKEGIHNQLMSSQEEKEALQNKLVRLSEEMSDVTTRVSALELSITSLESEKDAISTNAAMKLSEAENEIAELKLALEAKRTNEGLESELNRISVELSESNARSAELERELMARNEQHHSHSTKLEKELSILQSVIRKMRSEFGELVKFCSARLDLITTNNRELQVQLCMEVTKNRNVISELTNKLNVAEAEIAELEAGFCSANAGVLMKQHQIELLEEKILELENFSSNLSLSLDRVKDKMSRLIETSTQQMTALETSCVAVQVELNIALAEKQNLETKLAETSDKLKIETVDREKLASDLRDSMVVLETLTESALKSEETYSATLADRTAENDRLKSQLEESKMNFQNLQKNFTKLTLDSRQYVDELQLSKRSLVVCAAEETNAKNKLINELKASETLIAQLKDFIESSQPCEPRGSLKDDGSPARCTPLSRSNRSEIAVDDRLGISSASLGVDETCYGYNTLNFERSVFVSDLPMERTICVDNLDPLSMTLTSQMDPLSMTIAPEKLLTPPRRMLSGGEDSSDESTFGTPLAVKWGNDKSAPGRSELETVIRVTAAKDQIRKIATTVASLKLEVGSLFQSMHNEIMESFKKISLVYNDNLSQKENKITELDEAIANLHETVLTSSLEKESLRDELKKQREAADALKKRLEDIEIDNSVLIEERDVVQMQVNRMEKTIEEALRLWHHDEWPISEDPTQDLKSLVREVSNAKNLLSEYLKKPQHMDFCYEVKTLLSKSKTLDETVAILKTESLKKCKVLKDDCSQIFGDTMSLKAGIQESMRKMVDAISAIHIRNDKDDLEAQLKSNEHRISSLEAELDERIAHAETLQHQLEVQTDENNTLTATNSKLFQDLQDAKSANNDLHKKIEELLSDSDAMSAEILKLQETVRDKLISTEHTNSEEREKFLERISILESQLLESSENYSLQLKNLEGCKISLTTENAKLREELVELRIREKELSSLAEELNESTLSLSKKVERLIEINAELEGKLSTVECELAESKKKVGELTCASSFAGKSSLEVVNLLSALTASTAGQPVDLSCDHDDPLELLAHMKKVLHKSNDTLQAVFFLLGTHESSGIDALESLYTQLKDSDVKDVCLFKKKISTEISSLEPDMLVEDLVKLSLIELQNKLVSVIMEKERALIQSLQSDYENKLASKTHAMSQLENREKYMNDMIEDLTKENKKLEKLVAECKLEKSAKDSVARDVRNECEAQSSQVFQALKDEIESLKERNTSLSKDGVTQCERLLCQILIFLKNLFDDQNTDDNIIPFLHQMDIDSNSKEALRDIYSTLRCERSRAEEDRSALLELDKQYKELVNEYEAFKTAVSAFQSKFSEVSSLGDTREQQISELGAEKARLETEISELKRTVAQLGAKEAVIADLNNQLEVSLNYIEHLKSRESEIKKRVDQLFKQVTDLSKERNCLKEAFSQLIGEVKADVSKTMSYVEKMKHAALNPDNVQDCPLGIQAQLDSYMVACNEVIQEKQVLEESLAKESNQKLRLLEKVKELENELEKAIHEDETCPFKTHKTQCENLIHEKRELQILLTAETENGKRLLEKVRGLEERASVPAHNESCPYRSLRLECDAICTEKQKLEISLLKVNEEKEALLEKMRCLEVSSKPSHDDKSCPYKDRVQEYKKELWIIRSKAEEEKKNFDIMKKNLQEDLAFKSSTIKELEDRNEATISDFKQRLATSTASYNQLMQKLEETEQRISLLRELNSQDKKRFEKESEILSKELCRLQNVKAFLVSIGIENEKIQEALPEMKKKLCEYDDLKTALAAAEEKNAELDKECDDMCAEIKLLQTIMGEKCEENERLKGEEEKLRKEHVAALELVEICNRLENQLAVKGQLEAQLTEELKLKESQVNDISRKLADESRAKSELENAFKQLESDFQSRNQKLNQYMSQIKAQEAAVEEKSKLVSEIEATLSYKSKLVSELKSALSAKSKQSEELSAALEYEKSRADYIHGQKVAVEEQLSRTKEELASCMARLGTLPEVETKFQKLSNERDEALRRYQEIESRIPIVQKNMQDLKQQIAILKEDQKTRIQDRENAEQNWKAQLQASVDEINKLKRAITDKVARIVELESVLASLNRAENHQAKVSELQNEVDRLKRQVAEQSSNLFVRPQTTPVPVRLSPSSDRPSQRPMVDFEEFHKLEKKYTVLKRLAEKRRTKIQLYQDLLAQHNINVPNNEVSA